MDGPGEIRPAATRPARIAVERSLSAEDMPHSLFWPLILAADLNPDE